MAGRECPFQHFADLVLCTTTGTLCVLPSRQMYAIAQEGGIYPSAVLARVPGGCAVLYSPRRTAAIPYASAIGVPPVTTDEDSARRIRELEETVRVLEDQNVQLKIAAGALADRLNTQLMVESRESWRRRVHAAFASVTQQFGLSRLRT